LHHSDSTPNPKRWLILFAVMTGSVMGPIDGSVVNVALPTFAKAFNAGLHTVGWISMSYLLVLGSLILTYGRLGDMYGYRKIFLTGILIFTLSSAVCALAPNIWTLIAFRAVQAVGAGMFMAIGPAIITSVFPPHERGRALGTNGMIVAIGLALGPTLGGFLLNRFGWPSIFAINIPIGILSYIFCLKVIPPYRDLKPQKFDIAGAILGFISLGVFLLFASYGEEWGWASKLTIISFIVFSMSGWAFIRLELRVEQPMLDLSLFQNKVFSAANFAALMNFVSQSAMIFLLPFYMQQVLHFNSEYIGLILTVSPLTVLLLARISGTLSDRLGTRWLAFTGQSIVCAALFLMSGLTANSHTTDIVWRLFLFGLGIGIFQSPNNSAVMGSVPRHRLGIGSGVLATVRNVGMVMGIAVSSAIVTIHTSGNASANIANFMVGLKTAYWVSALLAASGAMTSLIRSDNIIQEKPKYQEDNPS
jgi:EmrB/QacA subfamily drug resistance transporter